MKKILFILLMITTSVFAQKQINNYKYVIVPNKFEFVKKNDQYKTSSLTKFLFNKHGFTALLADEKLPEDIAVNRCLALTGTVKDDSGMLTTKSVIELRDCFNKVVFTSKVGKSKNKDYKKAYHEAIRDAFKSIKALHYKYNNTSNREEVVKENKTIIEVSETNKLAKQVVVDQKNGVITKNIYAQPITNGFQLVNTKPEVVFHIIKTNVKDVFILKNKNGILYKSNKIWVAEYYRNELKVIENYQIKF